MIPDKNGDMTVSEYLGIRDAYTKLALRILRKCTNKQMLLKAAEEIGIIKNGLIVSEDDSDEDVVSDFLIYDYRTKHKSIMELFLDTEPALLDEEFDLLEAMLDAEFSFYEIIAVNPASYSLQLYDMIQDKRMHLIDTGFSRSVKPGHLIATRLVRISERMCMTSGVSFPFEQSWKKKLYGELMSGKLRNSLFDYRTLFIYFWTMHKQSGIIVRTENAHE